MNVERARLAAEITAARNAMYETGEDGEEGYDDRLADRLIDAGVTLGLDVDRLARALHKSMQPAGYGYIDIDRNSPIDELVEEARLIAAAYESDR